MCWTHLCVALVCDSATLPEAGDCTNTKSTAWWVPSSFYVSCSCPWSPFHPSDLREVSFLCMLAGAAADPSEAKPSQHQLKSSPPLPAMHQAIRCPAHIIFSGWATPRVTPKGCLSPYLRSSLTRKILPYYFST